MNPEPFKVVCDLQQPTAKIIDFALALMLMASEMEESVGCAVNRLASEIREQAKLLEEQHGVLFDALHPGPAAVLKMAGVA
jgi:hypothetical protein